MNFRGHGIDGGVFALNDIAMFFERLPHTRPASRIHRDDDVVRWRAASQRGFEREVDFLRPFSIRTSSGDEDEKGSQACEENTANRGQHSQWLSKPTATPGRLLLTRGGRLR
jgi:hypothetical protein